MLWLRSSATAQLPSSNSCRVSMEHVCKAKSVYVYIVTIEVACAHAVGLIYFKRRTTWIQGELVSVVKKSKGMRSLHP